MVHPSDDEAVWFEDSPAGLAARVRMARKQLGWSQRKLSSQAGLASSHVGTIEAEKLLAIGSETLRRLAHALEVPFAWLASGEGDIPWEAPLPEPTPASAPAPEDDGRYPNRLVAAKLLAGRVDPETIDALRSMRMDSDRDLSVAEWAAQARVLQGIRNGVEQPVPLDEDDAPKRKK